ncbi:MAG: MCE family protein [Hymenobacteraceae bacterium]|nr:MCE family protein [Hymenobacteraceae bacterium]
MPQRPASNHIRLGLFVVVGLGCLLVTLFLLGRKQNLFSRSMVVQADFRNVSGLLTGNNVRLGGITVGTVKQIQILNDTTVRVEMSLNREVRPFVRKNTVAAIGTDGLVGNTIINLTANPNARPAPLVDSGDILPTRTPVGIEAMLGTLDISNKNLVGITEDLHQITSRLNGDNAFWKLLDDEQLATNVRTSMQNAAATAAQLNTASRDVQLLVRGVRQGRGPAGYLLTDTAFAGRLGHAARQLAGTSDTLAAALTTLKRQTQTGGGPLSTVLADTALSGQLRQTMRNVEQGTAGFNQNMEALRHNFLLRGYFRRQAKKQARAAGQ